MHRATDYADHPFFHVDGPLRIAHGGAGEAPKSTLRAFTRAVELGFDLLVKVRVTADGVPVASHEPRLEEISNRSGEIARLTYSEVADADAGHWYTTDSKTFPLRGVGVRVPRVEEVLERWPDVGIVLDVPSVLAVAPLVRVVNEHSAWDRICVSSLSDRGLHDVRRLSEGRACTSMGHWGVAIARLPALAGYMPRLGATCVRAPARPWVTRRFVESAHDSGLGVLAGPVNSLTTMRRLCDLGVDGIVTDRPELLDAVLRGER